MLAYLNTSQFMGCRLSMPCLRMQTSWQSARCTVWGNGWWHGRLRRHHASCNKVLLTHCRKWVQTVHVQACVGSEFVTATHLLVERPTWHTEHVSWQAESHDADGGSSSAVNHRGPTMKAATHMCVLPADVGSSLVLCLLSPHAAKPGKAAAVLLTGSVVNIEGARAWLLSKLSKSQVGFWIPHLHQ